MATLNILLADDHEVVRLGARMLIEREPDWHICAEAANGKLAIELAIKLVPDVVVLDFAMPEFNGLEATRQIKRALPNTEILIFTGEPSEQIIHEVFAAGARSYILKSDISQHLVAAIRALSQHKHYFTGGVEDAIFARYLNGISGAPGPQSEELSAREHDLIRLLSEGKSNKEISALWSLSIKTIEAQRSATMRKLGLESFADLVRYAIRHKIIAP